MVSLGISGHLSHRRSSASLSKSLPLWHGAQTWLLAQVLAPAQLLTKQGAAPPLGTARSLTAMLRISCSHHSLAGIQGLVCQTGKKRQLNQPNSCSQREQSLQPSSSRIPGGNRDRADGDRAILPLGWSRTGHTLKGEVCSFCTTDLKDGSLQSMRRAAVVQSSSRMLEKQTHNLKGKV